MRLYSIVIAVPKILHQFLGRSKITETVKVHDAVVPFRVPNEYQAFFLVVFFGFMPMPILVLTFIAVQTAAEAAFSLRAESLAVTRPRALSASTSFAACLSLLREYVMSCSRLANLRPRHLWLVASPAEGRKTGSPEYVIQKKACLSLDRPFSRPRDVDIRYGPLSGVQV